jgi:hypothetical protein
MTRKRKIVFIAIAAAAVGLLVVWWVNRDSGYNSGDPVEGSRVVNWRGLDSGYEGRTERDGADVKQKDLTGDETKKESEDK